MSHEIEIEYNSSLVSLEDVLKGVVRPGDFFMEGAREIPMPTVKVDGCGSLSFPILDFQAKALIEKACLAPYGRGEDTILDTSVRKTWQIPADEVQISGKSWKMHFDAILDEVKRALGCYDVVVSAELYKLLIYDEGGFFLPHRDSEKSPGMFGTMIIALPSLHEGGQLIVRHKDNDVVIDLSGSEGSELKFAAFYADCEHEVLAVTKGYRICLAYNLIQNCERKGKKTSKILTAPCYDKEIEEASDLLKNAFNDEMGASKLIWLLEHQYSTAEISFNFLKNADAAVAKVLIKAAEQAKCAIYLGIVHIEESGAAEPNYGYYHEYDDDEDEYDDDERDEDDDDYEILDICDSEKYVDSCQDLQNQQMNFGKIPFEECELLPSDALIDVKPDEQRLLEATGNEGVSFERAYHRAAIILWPESNFIKILLQSGLKRGVTYFKEQIDLGVDKNVLKNIAKEIIYAFEEQSKQTYRNKEDFVSAEMLTLLCQLQENFLIEIFITVIIESYEGSENKSLLDAANILNDSLVLDHLFSDLFQKNISKKPNQCIGLFKKLTPYYPLKQSSEIILNQLEILNPQNINEQFSFRSQGKITMDSESVVLLWHALNDLDSKKLQNKMVSVLIENFKLFDPRLVLAPTLAKLKSFIKVDSPLLKVWEHTSNFLLATSEYPPVPPTDWFQEIKLPCTCEDCRQLETFAKNPALQTCRFQCIESRRSHLERQMEYYRLDMSYSTDRSRRPYTLVCTKTRQRYQEKCNEYQEDIKSMQLLIPLLTGLPLSEENEKLYNRLMNSVKKCNIQ